MRHNARVWFGARFPVILMTVLGDMRTNSSPDLARPQPLSSAKPQVVCQLSAAGQYLDLSYSAEFEGPDSKHNLWRVGVEIWCRGSVPWNYYVSGLHAHDREH